MAKVVNLRSARKERARAERREEAAANAARHGRSKLQKAAEKADEDRAARHLDRHRIEGPDEP